MKFVIYRDKSRLCLATADEWVDLSNKYNFRNADPKEIDMDMSLFNALQSSSLSNQIQSYLRELYHGDCSTNT